MVSEEDMITKVGLYESKHPIVLNFWRAHYPKLCILLSLGCLVGAIVMLHRMRSDPPKLPDGVYNNFIKMGVAGFTSITIGVYAISFGLIYGLYKGEENFKKAPIVRLLVMGAAVGSVLAIIYPALNIFLSRTLTRAELQNGTTSYPTILLPGFYSWAMMFLTISAMGANDYGYMDLYVGLALSLAANVYRREVVGAIVFAALPTFLMRLVGSCCKAYELLRKEHIARQARQNLCKIFCRRGSTTNRITMTKICVVASWSLKQ